MIVGLQLEMRAKNIGKRSFLGAGLKCLPNVDPRGKMVSRNRWLIPRQSTVLVPRTSSVCTGRKMWSHSVAMSFNMKSTGSLACEHNPHIYMCMRRDEVQA